MKTFLLVGFIVLISSITSAQPVEFIPSGGFCAFGRIGELKEITPTNWSIELTEVKLLLRGQPISRKGTSGILQEIPHSIKVRLIIGSAGGVVVKPKPEWTGRLALLVASVTNGLYTVARSDYIPLSPNGDRFAVFTPDQMTTVQAIEKTAEILNIGDPRKEKEQLAALVGNQSFPMFLRHCAALEFTQLGRTFEGTSTETRAQLIKWRNTEQFPSEFRLLLDDIVRRNSPCAYQWSEDRFAFFQKLMDTPELPAQLKRTIELNIARAQGSKKSFQEQEMGNNPWQPAVRFPEIGACAAIGRMGEPIEIEMGRWVIAFTDVKTLMQGPAKAWENRDGLTPAFPVKLTAMLNACAIPVTPTPEWTGKMAFFVASEKNGTYSIKEYGFMPLSPNGKSFFVFTADHTATIKAMAQIVNILKLGDSKEKQQQFAALLESKLFPLFINRYAAEEFLRIGYNSGSKADASLALAQMRKWCDNEQFTPPLRLCIDRILVPWLITPCWSEERFSFLRKLMESPHSTPELKAEIEAIMKDAEQQKRQKTEREDARAKAAAKPKH